MDKSKYSIDVLPLFKNTQYNILSSDIKGFYGIGAIGENEVVGALISRVISMIAKKKDISKSRSLEFERYAEGNRKARGERKPETFDFLGFTFYCSKISTKNRMLVFTIILVCES